MRATTGSRVSTTPSSTAHRRTTSPEDALCRLVGPGRGRCLDIGCGGGHFVHGLLELGWQLVGVDDSDDQLRIARERHPEIELVCADANALPFPDESFDAAYSTFTHTDFDDFARRDGGGEACPSKPRTTRLRR
jgi:ubiquinone/menaquinone biosynthesis C-methylase UbiE